MPSGERTQIPPAEAAEVQTSKGVEQEGWGIPVLIPPHYALPVAWSNQASLSQGH